MSDKPTNIIEAVDFAEVSFSSAQPGIVYRNERDFALQLINNNADLREAATISPLSLQAALKNVAAIGLSLNPAEKLAYLISRNIKIKGSDGRDKWIKKIFLEPSYMGLCRLATNSGSIQWAQANCVYSNDTFVDNGPGEKPTFTYDAFASAEARGEFRGAFAIAKTMGDDFLTTTMTAEEINSVKERSEAGKRGYGPWVTDFTEQAKKTVVRRAFKMWPRTDERSMERLSAAIHISNENEGFEPIKTSPNTASFTVDQKKYYDQLIESGDALGMYVLYRSIDPGVWQNLYHSFETPKGKYQRIVDDLEKRGGEKHAQIVADVIALSESDDTAGIMEIFAEMTQEESKSILGHLPPDSHDTAVDVLADMEPLNPREEKT